MIRIVYADYMDGLLRAKGYTIAGVGVLAPGDPGDPSWFVIDHPAGVKVRVDGTLPAEQAAITSLVKSLPYDPAYDPRLLWYILADISALAAPQQQNIWADLTSGVPPKVSLDPGPNAPDIMTMHFIATAIGGLTATEKNEARKRVMAYYTQDNPYYLIQPAFDPSITVEVYEPAGSTP